jgi:hypothetical protein
MGIFDFLYDDPSEEANKYLERIPGETMPYYQPYMQAGQRQLPGLEQQYGQLMNNPGGKLNEIGQGFHESPGFQFALKQALQGAGHAEAAGGMAGSPEHELKNMEIGTQLGNQDYYNWLNPATNLYNEGLGGSQGLYNGGFSASDAIAKILSGNRESQSSLAYAGGANRNAMNLGTLGAFLGGATSFLQPKPTYNNFY